MGAGTCRGTRSLIPPSEPGRPGLGGPPPAHTPQGCLPGQGLPHSSGRRSHSSGHTLTLPLPRRHRRPYILTDTRTHSGPIQRHVTQIATHACTLTHTHLHTSTLTSSAGCDSGLWGLLLCINIPAKTSELSCSLQRPGRRVPSELTWNQVGDPGRLSHPKPLHASGFPGSTKMPQKERRPLSWGGGKIKELILTRV